MENQIPNFIKQRKTHLLQAVKSYKGIVKKDLMYKLDRQILEIESRVGNEAVNKLFTQVCKDVIVTPELIY